MTTVTMFHVTIRVPVKGQLTEVPLGVVKDWETLKGLLYALLFSLKGTEIEHIIITPVEIEQETSEQA
jgi:hypothetical protein